MKTLAPASKALFHRTTPPARAFSKQDAGLEVEPDLSSHVGIDALFATPFAG